MNKWMNIPNTLSILRIVTIPPIIYLILESTSANYPWLIAIYLFSVTLDFFDGYLARMLSQETEIGKILDPIADKLMILSIVFALIVKTDFPLWLGIIIVIRDILILTASAIIYKGRHVVTKSILIGKVTFALLGTLLMVYIIDMSEHVDMKIFKHFLIPLSFTFITWSIIEYFRIYQREKNES